MEYYWELRSKYAQNIKALMCPLYMHVHWFIYLGQQEYAFLESALHFIQMTWFT